MLGRCFPLEVDVIAMQVGVGRERLGGSIEIVDHVRLRSFERRGASRRVTALSYLIFNLPKICPRRQVILTWVKHHSKYVFYIDRNSPAPESRGSKRHSYIYHGLR